MSEGAAQALALADPQVAIRSAVSLWAEQNTRPETLDRKDKLRDKVQAVTSFFDVAGKHPGEVTTEDVSAWRQRMEARGLKPATVYARVSRVSAFYRWLMTDPQLSRFIRSNPAAQARPRYPRPYQSESTKALSDDEMNSLLAVVERLAASGSVVGKRDYALLLFYFLTGLRRSEVISLRGRDLEMKDGTLIIKYRRKGGKFTAREVADGSAYEALTHYLKAAGRGNVLGTERPLWTRHDRAGKGALRSPQEPSWRTSRGMQRARDSCTSTCTRLVTLTRALWPRRGGAFLKRRRLWIMRTRRRLVSTSRESRSRRISTAARSQRASKSVKLKGGESYWSKQPFRTLFQWQHTTHSRRCHLEKPPRLPEQSVTLRCLFTCRNDYKP